jgi:CheY-like chemotaxis protein
VILRTGALPRPVEGTPDAPVSNRAGRAQTSPNAAPDPGARQLDAMPRRIGVMSETRLRGLKVFVVEDELLIALMLEDMLAGFGCVIAGVAANLTQALAMAKSMDAIDAAILDVNMGGELVFPVADVLLARNVKCVFSTGHRGAELVARYPGCRRLDKPYGMKDLVRVLTDAASDGPRGAAA